jgi:putative transcriptional regulator
MIQINLDVELAKRKMKSGELAERIGITNANLSILKTGKAKAVRLTTLDAICRELGCQPGCSLLLILVTALSTASCKLATDCSKASGFPLLVAYKNSTISSTLKSER